jgi:hypothetical protein
MRRLVARIKVAVNRLVAGSNPARGATGPFNTLERDFRMSHHFVPSGEAL